MDKAEVDKLKERNKVLGYRIQRYATSDKEGKKRFWLSYVQARRELATLNWPLFKIILGDYAERNDFEDIEDVANGAAWDAPKSFDPSKGDYGTHLGNHIRGAVSRYISEKKRIFGTFPIGVLTSRRKIMKYLNEIERERGILDDQEAADYLNQTLGIKLKILPRHVTALRILERPRGNYLGNCHRNKKGYLETLADEEENEKRIKEMRKVVNNGFLIPRERTIITKMLEGATLDKIGQSLDGLNGTGLTRARVNQLVPEIMSKLALRLNPELTKIVCKAANLSSDEKDIVHQVCGCGQEPKGYSEIAEALDKPPEEVIYDFNKLVRRLTPFVGEHMNLSINVVK